MRSFAAPPAPLAALLACTLLVAGCASSGGAAGERGTQSDPVRLGTPISSTSTVGTRDFVLRAVAECAGDPCRAESYRIVFSNVGQSPLRSTFAGVAFEVDGRSYDWDMERPGVSVLPNTYGEFLSVAVSPEVFEDIATAEGVRVLLGEQEFYLSRGNRRTFADLVARTSGV